MTSRLLNTIAHVESFQKLEVLETNIRKRDALRRWSDQDLTKVLAETLVLPGTASISWRQELRGNEPAVRGWAFSLKAETHTDQTLAVPNPLTDEMARVAELERQALGKTPEGKRKTSLVIERGSIGNAVKKLNAYRCQICLALGLNPISFLKGNGTPYVEAHHVTPVSQKQIGSLAASNIMTVCAKPCQLSTPSVLHLMIKCGLMNGSR